MGGVSLPLFFFFLATISAASHGFSMDIINQIHLLRPKAGARNKDVPGLSCQSWRFGVETNNIIRWATVPEKCVGYLGHYMLGQQYRYDSEVVANEAILYAHSLKLAGDGKDIWVFDIDETSLSNLPYYARHGFGAEPYNSTLFDEWATTAKAPPLPASLKLYKKLLSLGIKIVFLTGRHEYQRNATATNLKHAGFYTWEKLILKGSSYTDETAVVYKSSERKKLEKKGYRIIGNIGDQWSDLLGTNTGNRAFKLPDPMYYIS